MDALGPDGNSERGIAAEAGAGDEIRLADEIGDEAAARIVVDILRPADLQDMAVAHDRDAVRHRERLLLVMGDQHEGDARLLLEALQLALHLLAQLQVERRKRLVEQQHAGLGRQGTGQRHALLLAARELGGPAAGKPLEPHHGQGLGNSDADLRRRPLAHLEPEGDILRDVQMGKQRIALEDGIDRPLLRREGGHILRADADAARRRRLEAGDEAKQGRLAAARGAEQGEELVVADRHADRLQRMNRGAALGEEGFGDLLHIDHRRVDAGSRRSPADAAVLSMSPTGRGWAWFMASARRASLDRYDAAPSAPVAVRISFAAKLYLSN